MIGIGGRKRVAEITMFQALTKTWVFQGVSFPYFNSVIILGAFVLIMQSGYCQNQPFISGVETEEETIAKCLADLNSTQVEVRQRAVLILGKYNQPNAMLGIQKSLRDPASLIRRSALVSLTEKKAIPATIAQTMLEMIADEDVYIRRIISSYIPEIFRFRSWGIIITPGQEFDEQLKVALVKAFADSDVTVRKNMITYYHYFQTILPAENLKKLLLDADRDVRMLALQAASITLSMPELFETIARLTQDPDISIRKRLTQILGQFNDKRADKILEEMIKDSDFEIAHSARLKLLLHGQPAHDKTLRQALDDPRIDPTLAESIIQSMPVLGDSGRTALQELMKHPNPGYRTMALKTYGLHYRFESDVELLFSLACDNDRSVREAAEQLLPRIPQPTTAQLMSLAKSRFGDNRKTAILLSRRLNNGDAALLLEELMLDDQQSIRSDAVGEIIRRQLDNWETITTQTLADKDQLLRQQVLTHLLRFQPDKGTILLQEIAATTTDITLRQLILPLLGGSLSFPPTIPQFVPQ